jgi:hypothetical protein
MATLMDNEVYTIVHLWRTSLSSGGDPGEYEGARGVERLA